MINQFICEFKITNFINEFGNKLPNCFCQFVNKFINSFYEFIYKFIKANFSLKYIHLLVSSCLFIIIPAYAQSTSFSGVQIGATQAPSTYSYSGGTYSLTASGSGIGGTSDSGYFVKNLHSLLILKIVAINIYSHHYTIFPKTMSLLNRFLLRILINSMPSKTCLNVESSISIPEQLYFSRSGNLNVLLANFLYQIAKPSPSKYKIFK